ncbi:MAG: histidine kinase [Psychroserpens sp.]|nr:histidine kinase [Psychroserpens sp.]
MRVTLTYYFFSLILLVNFASRAQNNHIKVYTLEDGLPQSQIHAMAQDYKGYLWLGTQGGGLAKFDGERFEVYNESNGLSSNYINSLLTLGDTLYIGTNIGLTVKTKYRFNTIDLPHVLKVISIRDQILVLTKKGVYEVLENFQTKMISLPETIGDAIIKDIIFHDSYYWIATNGGLWRTSSLKDTDESVKLVEQGQFVALSMHNDNVYASTFDDGTLVFSSKRQDDVLIREPLRINTSAIINNEQLWILSENDGTSIIDLETNSELFYLNSSNGLPVSNVKQVLQDRESNVWLATSGGGLVKYFQNSFKHYSSQTGLKGDQIYAVHHSNDAIWIATSDKGIMRLDDNGIHDVVIPDDFSDVKIKAIRSDQSNNLWLGSEGKGIMFKGTISLDSTPTKRSVKTKTPLFNSIEVTKIWNSDNKFPFDRIRDIEMVNNTIYAASYDQGIVQFTYDAQSDNFNLINTFNRSKGIEDLELNQIAVDNNNRLWYVSQQGHIGYILKNRVTHLGNVLQLNVPIHSILFYRNTLFLGTAGEGIWWSSDTDFNTFRKLQGTKDVSSENIYQLIVDDQGFLWAGTERGVDKLQINNDNEIIDAFFFGRNDGFLGTETCLNAVDKDDKGRLWFGTLYGLSEYEPYETDQNLKKPIIYLEDLKVAYNSIDSVDLVDWTNSDKVWQLSSEQKQVSFTYKSIDLNHADGIAYRYKLNDDEWSPWTSNDTQEFSALNYGEHKFIVQSRNHRWLESDPISFSFFIESPLHKKPWFIALVIGIIVLILVVVVIQYIKRLKHKSARDKKQLELENHLLSLEQKALRLQMNPHFIFNVLNGIKAMAPSKPEKMNDTVNSFASLLRETLVNSREETISLDQEIKTLKHYIEVEQLMSVEGFDYQIDVNSELDAEEILIPPMLIQPFVENAIRHGILKGPRKGHLAIQFEAINETLKVRISDNGIGIYQSQQQKTKTDHQSMALKVTKERLESIAGKDALNIEEIKDAGGSTIGTSINFELPLETDF